MNIVDRASRRSNRLLRSLIALLAAGCAFACDEPVTPDGGAPDAHVTVDAHLPDSGALDAGALDAGSTDAGARDAGSFDAGHDAGPIDAGPPGLVSVSHPREMRAVWLTTVFGLDFPSATNLSAAQARTELEGIVDVSADAGFNTIFFQVRPESDALYASSLEPWSRFLTGSQGTDPGYDPLAILLELAHERGIEVHAWINPYRAQSGTSAPTAPNHVTNRFPDAAITHDGSIIMDPSNAAVRAHIVNVLRDLTRRYDIDGLVVDDYFYPYGGSFPDDASYDAYVDGGGLLSKSNWRRDNVNAFMADAQAAIKAEKPWARWGAAPFGIYRPGMPPGVTGTDAYEVLACDALHWLDEGSVDYIAPQLYWPTWSAGQDFDALIAWWADQSTPERPVIPSLAIYKIGTTEQEQTWTTGEMEDQVASTRAEANAAGQTWFRYEFIETDAHGERGMLAGLHATPALPPVVPGMASSTVEPPIVRIESGGLALDHASIGSIRGYAVYRWDGTTWAFTRWVPAASRSVALDAGRYAVAAVNRGEVESLGVDVTLR